MEAKLEDETIDWLRPASSVGAELLVARNCARKWHYFHEHYAACACSTAASGWMYRNREHFYRDRTTGFMEPGETHSNTRVLVPQDFVVLMIDPLEMSRAAYECGVGSTPHFRLAVSDDPAVYIAIQTFAACVRAGAPALEQQTRYAQCIRVLLGFTESGDRSPGPLDSSIVQKAKDFLRERYRDPVTLDELAHAAGVSRYHLVRLFKQHVGIPPHSFQTCIRIERGRAMLRAGVAPAVVAAELGFADQSHFIRRFRDVAFVTPGRYVRGSR